MFDAFAFERAMDAREFLALATVRTFARNAPLDRVRRFDLRFERGGSGDGGDDEQGEREGEPDTKLQVFNDLSLAEFRRAAS